MSKLMNIKLKPEDEVFIEQQLAEGRFQSVGEIIHEALRLLETQERGAISNGPESGGMDKAAKPIWETFDEIISDVPEEELRKLPADAAEQHDHYLYGAPKREC